MKDYKLDMGVSHRSSMKMVLALHGAGRRDGGSECFYGWNGHSVDSGIERQHDGFEVIFFRYPV